MNGGIPRESIFKILFIMDHKTWYLIKAQIQAFQSTWSNMQLIPLHSLRIYECY